MIKYNTGIIIIVIILLLCYYIYSNNKDNISYNSSLQINITEAKARRFGLIIDLRTPKERSTLGYYPNSIPISIDKLQTEVPLDISSKNTWILVYSNGDSRAQMGAEILYRMGYSNVRYITQTYLSLMPGSS